MLSIHYIKVILCGIYILYNFNQIKIKYFIFIYALPLFLQECTNKMKKASTLIITNALETRLKTFDYNVFLLKRSRNMRSWPGAHVFPGGVIDDKIDTTTRWLDILLDSQSSSKLKENLSLSNTYFKAFINNNSMGSATNQKNFAALKLPNEIAYRLCAIRETFEETG